MSDPKNILIFNHRHMGDVLMTTSALASIRNHFKNSTIDCVTNSVGQEVLKDQRLVNNIFLEDDPIKNKYDIAILFKATFRNSLKSKLLKIPIRIGWQREANRFFLTHPIKTKSEHFIHMNNDLLGPLGINDVSDQMLFCHSERSEESQLTNYIVLNPGATTEENRWPAKYFAMLSDLIHSQSKHSILVTGVTSDFELAEAIIKQTKESNRIFNYTGKTSLSKLATLLKKAESVVTGDTGPMHLAIAVNSPNVIAIFGPANENLTGPLPMYGKVLAKDKTGNWRNGNPRFENISVSEIKPEEVFERLNLTS